MANMMAAARPVLQRWQGGAEEDRAGGGGPPGRVGDAAGAAADRTPADVVQAGAVDALAEKGIRVALPRASEDRIGGEQENLSR